MSFDKSYDVVVAGGGPGGLAAARSAAQHGARVLLMEQGDEFGSPTRTTGGSFIQDLDQLGVPSHLYHPIHRCRFLSPANSVAFSYDDPVCCVIDVRGVFQFLAERAADAGVCLQLGTKAVEPIMDNGVVRGVVTKSRLYGDKTIRSSVVLDATGYRSTLLKKAGVHSGFERFGVGAEFDFYAPAYDHAEAVLIVGSQVAPAGYAWAFPWGNKRVRIGVGIIHADSDGHPDEYLRKLCANANRFGINLTGAQPIEYHYGLIPSDGLAENLVGDGIAGVGDAAGQASALVGEGIRWAMKAGNMAGKAAAEAVRDGDCSAARLRQYEKQWKAAFGVNLRVAHLINTRIARWNDEQWDQKLELLRLLTPSQFGEALQTNLVAGWVFTLLRSHPGLIKQGFGTLFNRLRSGSAAAST